MATVAERTHFGTWLESELKQRGLTQTQLAAYIDRRPQVVSSWIVDGRIPKTDACLLIARVFHMSPDEVLRHAGHLPEQELPRAEPELPSWLRAVLSELTDPELRVVERTAQGLLALREDQSPYEATPPAHRPPGSSPGSPRDEPPKGAR